MDLVTMILACSLYADNSIINAMVEVGSKNKPYTVTLTDGDSTTLPNEEQTISYANSKIEQGKAVEIGLMQIPSFWLKQNHLNLNEIIKPCKNMVAATQLLLQAHEQCITMQNTPPIADVQACTLSIYKTGDAHNGLDYANAVISYANEHPFSILEAQANKPSDLPASPITTDKKTKKPS